MEDIDVTDGFAPRLLLQMCLPYRGSDPGRERLTPMGVRLSVEEGKLPMPMDRLVMMFLTALAITHSEVRMPISAIARWVGERKENMWRTKDVAVRLRRLLNCAIEMPGPDGQRFTIGECPYVEEQDDEFYVKFSEGFRRAALDSVVIPHEHVRALSGHPFVLEVYTQLRFLLHDGEWVKKWDMRKLIRSSGARHHFGDRLKKALRMIARTLPKGPLGLFKRADVQCVRCDYDTFRVQAHGVDLEEENRRFAEEIDGMKHSEVRAYFQTQPAWRQRMLYGKYLDERMRPELLGLLARTDAVVEDATATAREIDARTGELRELRREAEAATAGLRAIRAEMLDGSAGGVTVEDDADVGAERPSQGRETAPGAPGAESAELCTQAADAVAGADMSADESAEPVAECAGSAAEPAESTPAAGPAARLRHRQRRGAQARCPDAARSIRRRSTSPRCFNAEASRPRPASRWQRLADRVRPSASWLTGARQFLSRQAEQPDGEAGRRPGPIRRVRQVIDGAVVLMGRKLAGSPMRPERSAEASAGPTSRTFTPEQAATLTAAIEIMEQERAGSQLSAEELAVLKAGLDVLGIAQPEPGRAPAGKGGKLGQVVSRVGSLIAGKGERSDKGKRRGLLARLRRSGDG